MNFCHGGRKRCVVEFWRVLESIDRKTCDWIAVQYLLSIAGILSGSFLEWLLPGWYWRSCRRRIWMVWKQISNSEKYRAFFEVFSYLCHIPLNAHYSSNFAHSSKIGCHTQNVVCISCFHHPYCLPHPSRLLWFDHLNNVTVVKTSWRSRPTVMGAMTAQVSGRMHSVQQWLDSR